MRDMPKTFYMWAASEGIQNAGYWSAMPPDGGGNPSTTLVTVLPFAPAWQDIATAYRSGLDTAVAFVAAHATAARSAIVQMSEATDPPLTREAAIDVSKRNMALAADANRFDVIAAAIRAMPLPPAPQQEES